LRECHRSWRYWVLNSLLLRSYLEQIEKTDRLRDETVKAIVKSTNDMCVFKEQVSEHLGTLRQFAEEN
jgi:kinetochore protein NDC80